MVTVPTDSPVLEWTLCLSATGAGAYLSTRIMEIIATVKKLASEPPAIGVEARALLRGRASQAAHSSTPLHSPLFDQVVYTEPLLCWVAQQGALFLACK